MGTHGTEVFRRRLDSPPARGAEVLILDVIPLV
jgi:hypothetical protein